jgi:hypothetical protein
LGEYSIAFFDKDQNLLSKNDIQTGEIVVKDALVSIAFEGDYVW